MAKKKPKPPPLELNDDELPRRVERSGWGNHGQKRSEWEPSAYQWAIYDLVKRGNSYRTVAQAMTEKGYQLSFQRVGQICTAIDDFLAQQYIDNTRAIRARHTEHLEHIFCEAMLAWERSKDSGDPDKPKPGAPAFLFEARSALTDIRKIHAVDKNPKLVEMDENADDDRVAGKSREAVLDEHINRLLAAKKAMQVTSNAT